MQVNNCLNCEADGECYECYILSGKEAFDKARMDTHKRLYETIWINHYASFEAYMEDISRVFAQLIDHPVLMGGRVN